MESRIVYQGDFISCDIFIGKTLAFVKGRIMIKKIDEYTYQIKTNGLGTPMIFSPQNKYCDITYGIGIAIDPVVRGGWVYPSE